MAKSGTIYIDSRGMTELQWQMARMEGLGGSDVGTVMGLNPYKAPIELFWEKVTRKIVSIENEATFAGKVLEDIIADVYWQHWDPDKQTFEALVSNYKAGNRVRTCRRINKIVKHSRYPWLLGNIDRQIQKGAGRGRGVLEIKTGLSQAFDKYEAGIPPTYVVQPQSYLVLLPNSFDYCELAFLVDGRYFKTYEFERNAEIRDRIVESSKDFWDRITQARTIWDDPAIPHDEKNQMIAMLEPEVDGSEGWGKFLSETYSDTNPPIQATPELIEKGYLRHVAKAEENAAIEKRSKIENEIKNAMRIHGSSVIDCGELGQITWRPDKNGTLKLIISKKLKEWKQAS